MANSVTQAQINEILSNSQIEVQTLFDKTTVVTAKLPNGFIIVESSSCVDPANYCETLGKDICLKRIENKVWELEGYKLQSVVATLQGCSTNDLAELDAEFGFDIALSILKEGEKVARKGWNGKDMYIQLNKGTDFEHSIIEPFLVIKNVKNSFNTWVPSISDLVAEDWVVVK
jgi:hypothetical protein